MRNLKRHSACLLVNDAIRGENNRTAQLVRLPGEVADLTARFLDQQNPGGGIPGLQPEFPKTIKAPRRHACQIQRSRTVAPNTMRA